MRRVRARPRAPPRGAHGVLRRAVDEAREDRITTSAQALAYSLFLAIPATLLVLLGVFSLVTDEDDVARLVERLESIMPPEAAELLGESLERSAGSASGGVLLTLIGLALAVWTTTSAATALMDGITTAFDGTEERSFVRKRLRGARDRRLPRRRRAPPRRAPGPRPPPAALARRGDGSGDARRLGLVDGAMAAPPRRPPVRVRRRPRRSARRERGDRGSASHPAPLVALVVWLAASGGLAFYSASFGSFEKTWGTLSAVVVTLIWLWLGGAALLFGAEIDSEVEASRRETPPPA